MKARCIVILGWVSFLGASMATAQDPAALRGNQDQTPPAISPEEEKRAEDLFQQGRTLFFQGNYLEAIDKLAAAVDANPAKTSYQLLLAKGHRYAKQDAQAMSVLEKILLSNPEHVEAGIDLAELLSPTKEPDRVIAILEPLLKFNHDYPINHLLAEANYEKEQFDAARKYFEEATKLNPRNETDHYQLGNIYLAQKRFAKAATAYETAGQLGMSSGVYHFKLASVYSNLHNYLGQIATAEVIGGQIGDIKNDMYLVDAVPGQEDTFYVAGTRSAIYQVAKAQRMGIDIFDIQFLEANIWLSARRYAKAEEIYTRLRETLPEADAGLFWYYSAQTALGLQDYDGYLERLRQAIEVEPDVYQSTLADAFTTVADRYHRRGDKDRYIEYLNKAVETNPLSARLHLLLGDAHWLASGGAEAIKQYQLVLELEPDHPQRVRLLNRIRGQDGGSQ